MSASPRPPSRWRSTRNTLTNVKSAKLWSCGRIGCEQSWWRGHDEDSRVFAERTRVFRCCRADARSFASTLSCHYQVLPRAWLTGTKTSGPDAPLCRLEEGPGGVG